MRLEFGEPAPAFSGETVTGETLSSADLAGETVLLKFYRFAHCPICHLHVRELTMRHDELVSAGIRVVAVYHSPVRKVSKALKTIDVPFTIIADPGKKLFADYGVERSVGGMFKAQVARDYLRAMAHGYFSRPVGHEGGIQTHPADFLIGPDGVLQHVHYGDSYADSMNVDAVLAAARVSA